ncbi:MAG: hypothetical protein D6681_13970 [Calditrichaeota bacterium]|nr:MAG: hypothetical protein D6681_13970 [Calditrichota bacterium]
MPKRLQSRILKAKKKEVREIRRGFSEDLLKAAAFSVGGDFRSVEVEIRQSSPLPLFVELKSILFPEKVHLENVQPLTIARLLTRLGVQGGIIVATDTEFLGGNPSWLNLVKANTEFPLIQRDFFVDPVQFYQGRAIGADAFLLSDQWGDIANLNELAEAAQDTGLEVFLELSRWELPQAIVAENVTGVIVPLFRNDQGSLMTGEMKNFLHALPEKWVRLGRAFPASREEIAALRESGCQGLVLADELWQEGDIGQAIQRVWGWCLEAATNDQG